MTAPRIDHAPRPLRSQAEHIVAALDLAAGRATASHAWHSALWHELLRARREHGSLAAARAAGQHRHRRHG